VRLRGPRALLVLTAAAAALAAAGLLAGGCAGGSGGGSGGGSQYSKTLTVLAGSELKDLEPLLADFERQHDVDLQFDYVGTLDGTERIVSGKDTHDVAWFSHAKYLELLQQSGPRRIHASTPIMLSPVVLGVNQSVAERLGWSGDAQVTWRQIAEAAKAGKLRFGMTSPASSNSGFTALLGVASAFAGSADAIDAGKIDDQALADLFAGQKLTAGSSGWLADAFVASQDQLDGMINYESVLLSLNAGGKLKEPLTLIYPKEGIVTANYPLLLLHEDTEALYDKLVAYLLSAPVQAEITDKTLRRPVTAGVTPDPRLPQTLLVELPFPSSVQTIDKILYAYLDRARPPARATFVLDVSGSMSENGKLDQLKQALTGLTGLDPSLTGQFSRFHDREDLSFITFADQVLDERDFAVTTADTNSPELAQIREYVDSLDAGGNTAIYDALVDAYQKAAQAQAAEPDRYYSIVLMTDGQNNRGRDASGFVDFYRSLPEPARQIRAFPVLFGEASPAELEQIASVTGGKVFDARSTSLSEIFKEIRGYQ
jgi:Ca-activated chloride channel family protein